MAEQKTIVAEHASASGHWYDKEGNPVYEIIGANGKRRNTNLGDAKKLGLKPSVTSIIACAASPGLEKWKIDQMLLACLTLPRIENEPEEDYLKRLKNDAGAQGKKARDRGTLIHAYVQSGFEGECLKGEALKYYQSANKELLSKVGSQKWKCEMPFSTERYGGKCDLHCNDYIIDIKTSQKPIDMIKIWQNHCQQLAAYRTGLFGIESLVKCGILFINTDTIESKLIIADDNELIRGWKCFSALTDYYYAVTGL